MRRGVGTPPYGQPPIEFRRARCPHRAAVQGSSFYRCAASAAAAQEESQYVIRNETNRVPRTRGKRLQVCKMNSVRGFLNRRFKLSFWSLLGQRPKVTRARKRETPLGRIPQGHSFRCASQRSSSAPTKIHQPPLPDGQRGFACVG